MQNFAYSRAADPAEAAQAASAGAAIAAGTTELLNWMRLGISSPERLVDISGLPELRGISRDGDTLVIGALSTLNEVGLSEAVRADAPVLSQASLKAASAQLRNRATLGGNVLQRTRCPYFRAEATSPERMPWPCNKRVPGSGCAARELPFSRTALFGWTDECVATQPSDPVVALAALDAVAVVLGEDGRREIAMRDFHLSQEEAAALGVEEAAALAGGAADAAMVETRLRPGELIISYRIPVDAASRRSAYLKVRERESYEYAMVSAAVCLDVEDGTVTGARAALGSVAQKPWRVPEAEAALAGAPLTEAALSFAFSEAMGAARPLEGQEWKRTLAANTLTRAAMLAGGMI